VALAYIMSKRPYVFPIVGCRKIKHLKGNIDTLSVSLSDHDIIEMDKGYLFDPGYPHTSLSGTLFNGAYPDAAKGPGDVWLTKEMRSFDWVQAANPIKPVSL
jgi:hypothetical protein